MPAPIHLLSIDAYGTIFDMTPINHRATQAIVDRHLPGFCARTLSKAWSRHFMDLYHRQTESEHPPAPFPTITDLTRQALQTAFSELGLTGDADEGTAIWIGHLQTIPLYDDVEAGLAAARERFRLILTSDSDDHIIRPALARFQLPFEHTFVSESCQTYKMARNQGLLEVALRRLEIDPATVVHIGDSEADLIAAERAGCRGVWINRPGHPIPKRKPWRVIESFAELAHW